MNFPGCEPIREIKENLHLGKMNRYTVIIILLCSIYGSYMYIHDYYGQVNNWRDIIKLYTKCNYQLLDV